MKEAMFYEKQKNNIVKCTLCYQHCIIRENNYGLCLARKNIKGKLYSEVYSKIAAINIEPIEKKPLYHFLPGTQSLSIGTCGCNFKCKFCQNYEISQTTTIDYKNFQTISPNELIKIAKKNKTPSISYTYNEPTINYEYAFETAKKAHKFGIKNVFVTNGYIEKKPLKKISPYLDAANIDLKSSNKNFYQKNCSADLDKVLQTIKLYKKYGIHIELTTLIVPGQNDSKKDLNKISKWVYQNLGREVPMHFSAFYPNYKMTNIQQTSLNSIIKAVQIAKKQGIKYAYGGNVRNSELNNTYCPNCKTQIINRDFGIKIKNVKRGKCEKCEEKLPIYF